MEGEFTSREPGSGRNPGEETGDPRPPAAAQLPPQEWLPPVAPAVGSSAPDARPSDVGPSGAAPPGAAPPDGPEAGASVAWPSIAGSREQGLPAGPAQASPGEVTTGAPSPGSEGLQPGMSPVGMPPGPGAAPAVSQPRRGVLWAALGLVFLLLFIAAVTIPVVVNQTGQMGRLDRQATELRGEIEAQDRLVEQQRKDLRESFVAEDFGQKLTKMHQADQATDEAYRKWSRVPGTKFGVVIRAIEACYGAADAYNAAAAPYPEELFVDEAPAQIDLDDPRTDCGKLFLGKL